MPRFLHARRRPRVAALAAVVAALALLTAACAGSDTTSASAGDDAVASITDNTTGSNPDSRDGAGTGSDLEAPENPEDAFELFNQCMADAGLDFGDAIVVSGEEGPGGSGAIDVSPAEGGVLDDVDPQQSGSIGDFDFEEFEAANEACEGHLANVDRFFDMSPEERAAFEDAELEWRKCMEEQGVEVPDFVEGAGSGIVVESASDVDIDPQSDRPSFDDTEFEAFREASEACRHHFDEVAAG